ncbi:MAG: wax ester/triacylglycerol synthase family O-acyltransferase [Actinomycetota bacterium]|nr:wax ester/triacylglycerol synthase family O-acyltransferase [Actinomycetota bacterium]
MKQLSGVDANFLYMETPSVLGHVSSLSVYEPPADDPSYRPFDSWRAEIERRIHRLEPLTRKLRNVPFNLDHPYWVQDVDFDLDFHVRHTAVPPPGDDEQIAHLIARIIARPLDRRRPLWESYVIEGLAGGRVGILTKVHHAAVDGASGAELLMLMLDGSPGGDDIPPEPLVARPERLPTDAEMLALAGANLARKPARLLVLTARTLRDLGESTGNPLLAAAGTQLRDQLRGPLGALLNVGRRRPQERDEPPPPRPLPEGAPRTPFNQSITPHRVFAFRSAPLDLVKATKSALGATVNDVVMAVCAGGLRAYLDKRGALPDQPLVAMVPVSIRTGDEDDRWTNRVSGLVASLPTNEADPLQRVRKVHEAMGMAKGLHDAIPADRLTEFAQFPPPAVFTRASRMTTRFQLGNRFRSPVNLVISNVPGPRHPLYSAGAKLLHYYPVSTIAEGQGLNITVQSYLDTLDFGLVGCAELVPDIWDLCDAIIDDLEELAALAGVKVQKRGPSPKAKKAIAKG